MSAMRREEADEFRQGRRPRRSRPGTYGAVPSIAPAQLPEAALDVDAVAAAPAQAPDEVALAPTVLTGAARARPRPRKGRPQAPAGALVPLVPLAPRVSVVIPTYRRPELLERCLAALATQDLPPAEYEIIVADDASSNDTRRHVEGWAARTRRSGPAVRYMRMHGGRGPAAARNAGWRAAHGAVIAFTDDDCVPEPGWLRAGLEALADGAAGAAGRLLLPLSPDPTDYELDAARLAHAEFVTANCFYRRDAIARAGGFDERYTAAWREDSDLHFALQRAGERLAHAPRAVVVHPIRPAPWGVSLRQQRKSQFNALLYKKYPALYCQRIQARPPWRYYVIVGALGGVMLAAGAGWWWLGLLSAGLWTLLTARFCLQRLRGTSRAPRHVAEMIVTSALIPPLAVFWRLYGAIKYRVLFI